MRHDITTLDLIAYCYEDISYMDKMAIEHALQQNEALRKEYEQLLLAQNTLDELELMPNQQTIDAILNYSNESSQLTTS